MSGMRRLDMRRLRHLVVHCAYTRDTMDVGAAWIRTIHVKEKGFADIGYHAVVRRDGTVEAGRDMAYQGAHEPRVNATSWAVCLAGGMVRGADGRWQPGFNYTWVQMDALRKWLQSRIVEHKARTGVDLIVSGHNQWAAKDCPCFNVPEWWMGGALWIGPSARGEGGGK